MQAPPADQEKAPFPQERAEAAAASFMPVQNGIGMNGFARRLFAGNGTRAKALRGTASSVVAAGGGHILRFISNLILTRLLFPEAFGLMALVQVIMTGIALATTFGLRVSVLQNPRGDDPDFLNTVWTLQALRGAVIWVVILLLAIPFARLYGEPELAQMLPVAGLSLLIAGFHSTNVLTVQRHLALGRFTAINLSTQFMQIVINVVLAYLLQSVWALVIGMVVQSILALVLYIRFLPGIRNRFRLERESVREILKLGKFLFISTIATYAVNQSDRAILGLLIPIELLGIYNIGYALGSLASTLVNTIYSSVVFPLYRMRHPSESTANRAKIFKARRLVAGCGVAASIGMAFVGPYVIMFLYDDRYSMAGPMLVLLSAAFIPVIVLNGLMHSALAKGDSFSFMVMNVATAVTQVTLLYLLGSHFGIPGAAAAIGGAPLLTYPLLAMFLRRYSNWDPRGDAMLLGAGLLMTGFACWLYRDQIIALLP